MLWLWYPAGYSPEHFLKIKQRSKKEPPHSRDGTPCGELAIPYIDLRP